MARKLNPPTTVRARRSRSEPDWEARDALSTLQRAEEIKSNKGLMTRTHREAKRQLAAITKATTNPRGIKK